MWYHREAFVVNCQEKKVISRKRITSCSKLCGYLTDVRYKGLRQGGLGRRLLWLWISAVFNFRLRFISISYRVLCACLPSQVPVGQPVFLNTTSANTLWGHAGSSGHHCTAQPGWWGRLCAGPYVSPVPLPPAEPHINSFPHFHVVCGSKLFPCCTLYLECPPLPCPPGNLHGDSGSIFHGKSCLMF